MEICEKLKALRRESGLTQAELAKRLKIGQTTVAAYENGAHDPNIYSLIAYADHFGCSVDYLVGREKNAAEPPLCKRPLTDRESYLIDVYRTLSGDLKTLLVQQAELLQHSKLNGPGQ